MHKIFHSRLRKLIDDYRRKKMYNDLVSDEYRRFTINPKALLMKRILLSYHVIEKGLTMPNARFGFGQIVLHDLVKSIDLYEKKYGVEYEQVRVAIGVVKEYYLFNREHLDLISPNILSLLENFLSTHNDSDTQQVAMTSMSYFSHINDSFPEFSASRHSLRNFSGKIDIDKVKKAISIAQNAPSACNRQSTRVYIIDNKEIISSVFKIQKGNRGFGHLADKLLLLTSEMGFWDVQTYNGGYIDGGIFAMNLLYSLHYMKIGACTLNANLLVEDKKKIYKLLGIPNSESLILFIAIGGVPENFNVTRSYRSDYNSIIKIIK